MSILAWHLLSTVDGVHVLRDGVTPAPTNGEVLRHPGSLVLCYSGLHASIQLHDALNYAPGAILCRVSCGGVIDHGNDKLVCTERTILARIDATETLRAFARRCALDVIHLWNAPEVTRRYLETGDEGIRGAAAGAAAWAAAGAAAGAATWATGAAAGAAGAATGAATWATRAAARAAGDAARAAAEAAAGAAGAAEAATWAKYQGWLLEEVTAEFKAQANFNVT